MSVSNLWTWCISWVHLVGEKGLGCALFFAILETGVVLGRRGLGGKKSEPAAEVFFLAGWRVEVYTTGVVSLEW